MKATYDDAVSVLDTLESAGHTAYLAGGCVRDIVLGLEPNDYDVTTSATPDAIQKLFPKTVPVGASFGVVKVICGESRELDVATFRTDGKYSDNRRPDSVEFSDSSEEDVKRRDFTINALLMTKNHEIIDHVGGMQDLKDKVLRTVGNPIDRFTEDSLRMLRAIRFAIRFKMEIHPDTWAAINQLDHTIVNVSKERITDELSKIFTSGDSGRAFLLLRTTWLWRYIFGECTDAAYSWKSILGLFRMTTSDPFTLALAIIFAQVYSTRRADLLKQLTLTNEQKKELEFIWDNYDKLRRFMDKTLSEKREIMHWPNLHIVERFLECNVQHAYFTYIRADEVSQAMVEAHKKEILDMGWPDHLINGNDLIEYGFETGPLFTEMLRLVRHKQLSLELVDVEAVKPFLIEQYPALTRRKEDGTLNSDTHFRRVASQCKCGTVLSFEVAKSPKGNYLWGNIQNKINCKYQTQLYVYCDNCSGGRKKKTGFVEVHV